MNLGFQPVPIWGGSKRPYGESWQRLKWDNEEQVKASFAAYAAKGATNLGLLLGESGGGLIDVDLDHPKALRLKDYFLPPTPMQTGRVGRPRSHRWYKVQGDVPATKQHKMPDGTMCVEFRSTGGQTLIPPSIWVDKSDPKHRERYRWEGKPWGGDAGPAEIDGQKLAVQVALLGLGAVLLDGWPEKGSRHEAYLALAGGLLRYGDSVHPFWEKNVGALITALAEADGDDDGPEARLKEVMSTTLKRLRAGEKAIGFTRLGELIGNDHAEQARRLARTVEQLAGFTPAQMTRIDMTTGEILEEAPTLPFDDEALVSTLPPENRNPMEERISTWAAVDLDPYLSGVIEMPTPSLLTRDDGESLFYPGRVNSLFGLSEAGKSWVALLACIQEMAKGERVMYIDLEDEPEGTLARLRESGVGDDDIRGLFKYVHPEGPLADMQRYRFGNQETDEGRKSAQVFRNLQQDFDPTLIILDGMTSLYGLHGHDTNEATSTDVIGTWLKRLCRAGRTTVVVIDHTGKGGGAGASPIGAHHKVAFIQGAALRVEAITRPMIGEVGRMRLIVFKDRPGAVRKVSTKNQGEQVAGTFRLDSREPGVVVLTLEAPNPDEAVIGDTPEMEAKLSRLSQAAELQQKMLDMFEGDYEREVTTTEVVERYGGDRDTVLKMWHALCLQMKVTRFGVAKYTTYRLYQPTSRGEQS